MTREQFSGLVDDNGTPVRWKITTLLAIAGLAVSVVIQIARAGAKSERLDNLTVRVEKLESLGPAVAAIGVRQEDILRRMDGLEKKVDQLLERGRR